MQGRFRITFADGSTEELDAPTASAAKEAAKNKRTVEVDPGRSMAPLANLRKHDRVKVEKIEDITEGEPDARAGSVAR